MNISIKFPASFILPRSYQPLSVVINFRNSDIPWESKQWNLHNYYLWKQPSIGVLIKRGFENMQQIDRKTPVPKSDFNKVVKQLY